MKSIIFFIYIATSLIASDNIIKTEPDINIYNEAKALFENQNYQQANDKFNELLEKDMTNPNVNFYLGRTYYMLKEYKVAIAAYERVLNVDTNSIRSKLEIAKCYFKLEEYKKSKMIFVEVLDENIPTSVKENIDFYLTAINAKLEKNFFSGSAVFGIIYDTNIYSSAPDETFTLPAIVDFTTGQPINVTNTAQDESGFSHQEALSLNHSYSYKDDIKLNNSLLVFNKSHFDPDHRQRDIKLVQYSPSISTVYNGKVIVDYALIINKIWLENKTLMTNKGIYPKLTYLYSPSLILGTSLNYQKKSTKTFDSTLKALEFTLRYVHDDKLSFSFYSQLYQERKDNSTLTSVDYDMLNTSLTSSYQFTSTITSSIKLQWYEKSYKDQDLFHLTNQEDDEFLFYLNTTYAFEKNILFSFDYIYTDHNSNIPSSAFKKETITANVIVSF